MASTVPNDLSWRQVDLPMSLQQSLRASSNDTETADDWRRRISPVQDGDSYRIEAEKILRIYEEEKEKRVLTCQASSLAVFGSLEALLMGVTVFYPPAGIATNLAVKALEATIMASGSFAFSACETGAEASAKTIIHEGFRRLSEEEQQLAMESPDKASALISGKVISDSSLLQGAPAEAQTLVLHYLQERLETKFDISMQEMQREATGQQHALEDLNKSLDAVKERASSLSQFFTYYSEKTLEQGQKVNAHIKDMHQLMGELFTVAKDVDRKLDRRVQDIEFLKGAAYANMSLAEKKKAIETGMIHFSESEKQNELKKIELLEKHRDLVTMTNNFAMGADILCDGLNRFGSGLGLKPKEIQRLSKGINIGQTALSVFTGLSAGLTTGNIFAAVKAISGLFGQKRDLGAERHKAVMKSLAHIQKGIQTLGEGQQHISRQIDGVVRNQQALFDNQRKTFEGLKVLITGQQHISRQIVELERQVDERYASLMDQLDMMHADIRYGIMLSVRSGRERANSAGRFLLNGYSDGKFLPHRPTPVHTLLSHLRNEHAQFTEGMHALEELFDLRFGDGIHPSLRLKSEEYEQPAATFFLTEIYQPAIALFQHIFKQPSDRVYASLMLPTHTMNGVKTKYEQLSQLPAVDEDAIGKIRSHISDYRELISTSSLVKYGKWLLQAQWYLLLIDEGHVFENIEALTKYINDQRSVPNREKALRLVGDVEKMTALAIAQQNLVAGDIMIPYLTEAVEQYLSNGTSEAVISTIVKVFQDLRHAESETVKNKVLEKNLMRFLIVKCNKRTLVEYNIGLNVALKTQDCTLLKSNFPDGWNLVSRGEEHPGIWLELKHDDDRLYLEMPLLTDSFVDYGQGVDYFEGVESLVELKHLAAGVMLDYEFERGLKSDSQKQLLHSMILV